MKIKNYKYIVLYSICCTTYPLGIVSSEKEAWMLIEHYLQKFYNEFNKQVKIEPDLKLYVFIDEISMEVCYVVYKNDTQIIGKSYSITKSVEYDFDEGCQNV